MNLKIFPIIFLLFLVPIPAFADYDGDYVISQISVSTYNMFERFRVLNESKKYKKMIKPFNFATIGTGYQFDEKKQPIIPFLPYASPEKRGQVPFMPFVDYKKGRLYSESSENNQHGTEYYWKPLAEFFENYVDYVKILQSIKPTRDYKKVGLSRRCIIELQKECKNGKQNFKDNVKEKLRMFQNLNFQS